MVDIEDYKTELVTGLADAWKLASEHIKEAQEKQKCQYDKRSKEVDLKVGDRVMVYMPQERKRKSRKVARPYFGPYRVLCVTPSNVEVRLVDKPTDPSIFVSLDRVRTCYPELRNVSWSGKLTCRRQKKLGRTVASGQGNDGTQVRRSGPVTRSQTRRAHSN